MDDVKKKKIIIGVIIGLIVLVTIIFVLFQGCVKKYTVTFDSNGGTSVNSVQVKANEKVEKPRDPTKDGYEFEGWFLEEELFDFDTKIEKNITLVAHWKSIGIELEKTKVNLLVGKEEKLNILTLPDGLKEEDLIYISSDESIATIDEFGTIKALKEGIVTITIKTKDGKYVTTCEVVVTEEKVEIESISIHGYSSVTVGSSIELSVSFNPENATSEKLTWESSDSSIATVDENGRVKGVKEGTVVITVTTESGKSASKTITVNQKTNSNEPSKPADVAPEGVSISGENEVYVGKSISLTATVTPDNATNKKVTWSIDGGTGKVTVDQNGNVTGVSEGEVTIKVTTANGISKTFVVTVISKYELRLTKVKLDGLDGVTYQYQFKITKDGKDFTNYLGFTLNGQDYVKVTTNPTIASTNIKDSNTAIIALENGSTKPLDVVIQ